MPSETLGVGTRVNHPAFEKGVITAVHKLAYDVTFMKYGTKTVTRDQTDWEIIEAVPYEEAYSFSDAEKSLVRILKLWSDVSENVRMDDRWNDGIMILQPGDKELKSKEIPLEVFFHKIVMVRDRLRVMEQKINASKNLTEEQKIDLQQYLTRIYGSLTTFNLFFKEKNDYFVGERSK